MCTVSVVPIKNGLVFTFNRDEKPERHTPHFMVHEKLAHKEIYYAKDSKAGGTWFAADSLGNAAMLFNGAFSKHEKQAVYKKSRGVILLAVISAQNMLRFYDAEDLEAVEPFSILLFENGKLYRLTWDGIIKHAAPLSNETNYIFSSATLYDEMMQQQRRLWLAEFFIQQQQITGNAMFQFHSYYKKEDKQNGLIIERPGGCSTLSISQLIVTTEAAEIKHLDLKTGEEYQHQITFDLRHCWSPGQKLCY
jgi:Transport and Golgi organisation 2